MSGTPVELVRGMTVATHRSGAGVATNLFEFDLTKARADGYAELSVNWHDSDEAIQSLLMAEKTPGVPKFQFATTARTRLTDADIHGSLHGYVRYAVASKSFQ